MFSYCKSTEDDDPQGVANLDPRSMVDRIYVVGGRGPVM